MQALEPATDFSYGLRATQQWLAAQGITRSIATLQRYCDILKVGRLPLGQYQARVLTHQQLVRVAWIAVLKASGYTTVEVKRWLAYPNVTEIRDRLAQLDHVIRQLPSLGTLPASN